MFAQIVSASVPYADIAFFAIILIGLILGVIRGFSKSFKGLFLTIAILLASLMLLSPTFASVRELDMFQQMESSITDSVEDKTDLFSKPIYMVTDAESGDVVYYVDVQLDDGSTQRVSLDDGIDMGNIDSLKAKLALWLAERFITEDGQTLGAVAGTFISDCIVAVIMFIVYCLALWLICWVLRKIFAGMRKSESRTLKAIDRIAGTIVSGAFACIFALLVLAILYALRDNIGSLNDTLANSAICGPLYENNPISILFKQIFG